MSSRHAWAIRAIRPMRDIRTGINVALENRDEGIAFLFREPRAIPVQIRASHLRTASRLGIACAPRPVVIMRPRALLPKPPTAGGSSGDGHTRVPSCRLGREPRRFCGVLLLEFPRTFNVMSCVGRPARRN